jgi:hypothetical protein
LPQRMLGESCDSSDDCAVEAFCDHEVGSICAARRELGETCSYDDCESGAVCAFVDGRYACSTPAGEGQVCDAWASEGADGCAEGLACVESVCAVVPSHGQQCGDDGECGPGLACREESLERRDVCLTPGGEGESCRGFGAMPECMEGLFCDGAIGQCARRRTEGEACDYWGPLECTPGLSCLGDFGVSSCQPLPGAGAPCASECVEGLACVFGSIGGRCVPSVCALLPGRRVDPVDPPVDPGEPRPDEPRPETPPPPPPE